MTIFEKWIRQAVQQVIDPDKEERITLLSNALEI